MNLTCLLRGHKWAYHGIEHRGNDAEVHRYICTAPGCVSVKREVQDYKLPEFIGRKPARRYVTRDNKERRKQAIFSHKFTPPSEDKPR